MPESHPTVAHVLHQLYLAGAEILAADLTRKLSRSYRFVFLCLDQVGPLGHKLAEEGFEVINLGRRPGVDWSVARRIRHAIRQHRIDLLHAHQYGPFFYAAASRRASARPPILFTEHGRHYPDYRRARRVIANKFLLRRNDRVTAVGRFVKQALVNHEGIAANRVKVVYNGIDPQPFSIDRAAEERVACRREFGVGPSQAVVLQVARFHPVKDHATTIRAFAMTTRQVPDAVLLLVGDGEMRDEIQSLANTLGVAANVRLVGVRSDIPRLMSTADVFLLSSLSEGVSVTLLEAMAAALPVVATDVGGNPEVVVHDKTGLLSPRGDAQQLARSLVTLIRNPQQRAAMGRAGRDRLDRHFTQQQMHRAYAQIYGQMLAGARDGRRLS